MDCLRQFPENAKQAAGYQLQEKPENRRRRFGIGGKTLQQIDSGKEIMESQTFASVFDALCDTPAQAANMRLRAGLMMHIADTVRENGWTQKQAAEHCRPDPAAHQRPAERENRQIFIGCARKHQCRTRAVHFLILRPRVKPVLSDGRKIKMKM